MGEAKRRRDIGISLPKSTRQDWSRLNIPDCRVYLSAHIDGVPRFTFGWEATTLAATFPMFDARLAELPGFTGTLDWVELRKGQETVRQAMIAATSERELAEQAVAMAWFGLIRIPAKDYRNMTQELRDHKEYYIHAIYGGDQWVFFGSPEEASSLDISELLHATYPEKFPAIH